MRASVGRQYLTSLQVDLDQKALRRSFLAFAKGKIPTISGLIGMTWPLPAPWVSAVKCSGGPHRNWLVSKCHLSRTLRETPGGRNLETQCRTEEAKNLEWWVFPIWRGPREGLSVRNTCSYRHVRPALTSLLGCERI